MVKLKELIKLLTNSIYGSFSDHQKIFTRHRILRGLEISIIFGCEALELARRISVKITEKLKDTIGINILSVNTRRVNSTKDVFMTDIVYNIKNTYISKLNALIDSMGFKQVYSEATGSKIYIPNKMV